jgi:hypothetical protein
MCVAIETGVKLYNIKPFGNLGNADYSTVKSIVCVQSHMPRKAYINFLLISNNFILQSYNLACGSVWV